MNRHPSTGKFSVSASHQVYRGLLAMLLGIIVAIGVEPEFAGDEVTQALTEGRTQGTPSQPLGPSDIPPFSRLPLYLPQVRTSDQPPAYAQALRQNIAIPGRIEAENYRSGGEGVGYHDTTAGNNWKIYRIDGVDIEYSRDSSGQFSVGMIVAGEWLAYDINVAASQLYIIQVRMASPNSGKRFHLEIDGANVSGSVTVPLTGGWYLWNDVVLSVSLPAGVHVLRFVAETNGFNLNYFNITRALDKINHVIVIFQENHSFDSLYGKFPGANGIANAGAALRQVDKSGKLYQSLPRPINTLLKPFAPDMRFPANLPVQPFDISLYVPTDQKTGDMVHRFYQEQYQIDGGKMDEFIAWSDAGGLVLGYYDATNLPEGKLAQQYTLADNFFHAAFGGSFLNHFWLVCACTPTWPNAPASRVAKLNASGVMTKDGVVSPDGYVINTAYSVNQPHPASMTDQTQLVPNQILPTIGDRLSSRNISWAWYAGGWNAALAGHPDPLFIFHHQPFVYFANYADSMPAKAEHLKDEQDFLNALTTNNLPAVSFVKTLGVEDEHPGYATLLQGQQHVADLVTAVQDSPYWADTAIIITYDENGGAWDHVKPPPGDRWGPGTRVPAIIISPYARKGYIDHTLYDTTSILRFIELRWGLTPLGARDAAANDLSKALDFTQTP